MKVPLFKTSSRRLTSVPLVAVLLAAVGLISGISASAVAQDGSARAYLEYRASLSDREKKLPSSLLSKGQAQGVGSARALSDSSATPAVFRIDGASTSSLVQVISAIGAQPFFISTYQSYVTAVLTQEQVIELSYFSEVHKIRYLKAPIAQGAADLAHRAKALREDADPDLTGSNVVVGVIGLPSTKARYEALMAETAPSLPSAIQTIGEAIYDLSASSESPAAYPYSTPPGALELSEADFDAGVLGLAQIIHEMAPGATIVYASPGIESTPEQMALVIAELVAGDAENAVPPANIIVDDLLYPTENPFAYGIVSQSVTNAFDDGDGVLYVTAAGDGGRHSDTPADDVSDVYLSSADPIEAPAGSLFALWSENLFGPVHPFGGSGFLTVEQSLSDICLFWNAEPGVRRSDDLIMWVFDPDAVPVNGVIEPLAAFTLDPSRENGGGCLSEQGEAELALEAGYQLVISYASSPSYRIMITGERAVTNLSAPGKVFSRSTTGGIRGHAYSPDALTVGATPVCGTTTVIPYVETLCSEGITASSGFSSDGEGGANFSVQRFFWRDKNVLTELSASWEAVGDDFITKKPDLSAVESTEIREVSFAQAAASVSEINLVGTSASAASTAAIGALYWEYRQRQVTVSPALFPDGVRSSDVRQAMRASAINLLDDNGWDPQTGFGVIDAPRPLAGPLPALDLVVSAAVNSATLNFHRALNDISELFTYTVSCGEYLSERVLTASDSSTGTAGTTKAPISFFVSPGDSIQCSVVSSKAGVDITATSTAEATAKSLSAPVVTMTSKAAGVLMSFSAPLGLSNATYAGTCVLDGAAISGWTDKVVVAGTAYTILSAMPDSEITCTVKVSVPTNGDPFSATSSAQSAAVLPVGSTSLLLTADPGGFTVTITKDPDLASSDLVGVRLTCTQEGQAIAGASDQVVTSSRVAFETESESPVSCSATSTLTLNDSEIETIWPNGTSVSPEEPSTGLPVWLLYIATQPE